jgi:hypothetical protein
MEQDTLERCFISHRLCPDLKTPSTALILEKDSYSSIQLAPALVNGSDSKNFSYTGTETDSQAGVVVSRIEDILENMVDCISGEKKKLVIRLKSRSRHRSQAPNSVRQATNDAPARETRAVTFPGKTPQEAWKFSKDRTMRL